MNEIVAKETLSFKSGDLEIFYDIYTTQNALDSGVLIQIAHGMVEHRGKYEFIARKLAQAGFIVAINDHRGHGDSVSEREFFGEMSADRDKSGFELALNDMRTLSEILKERFKPRKFILIGHSMGSLLSRRYLQECESGLDGLILCGTPSPQRFLGLGILVLKICRAFGINRLGQGIAHKLSFLSFNKKYAKFDKLDSGKISGAMWINRDERELKKHIADKKSRFIFTINSFISLLGGVRAVFSDYPHEIRKPNLPILFISGEDDACGEFGSGVLKAFKHLKSQGYENVKCTLYANARHELFLELNKDEVAHDVIEFINVKIMQG